MRRRASAWRRFTAWLLLWTERLYLHAHGWDPIGDEYRVPDDYPYRVKYRSYTHGHAVNAQKQTGRS